MEICLDQQIQLLIDTFATSERFKKNRSSSLTLSVEKKSRNESAHHLVIEQRH